MDKVFRVENNYDLLVAVCSTEEEAEEIKELCEFLGREGDETFEVFREETDHPFSSEWKDISASKYVKWRESKNKEEIDKTNKKIEEHQKGLMEAMADLERLKRFKQGD